MGPYCQFCGQRCFIDPAAYIPEVDLVIWRASGWPMLATCRAGKAYDRMRLGINADDAQAELGRRA